jgi:hypothetical protein
MIVTTHTDTIRGYDVTAETCTDPNDPARGEWVDVFVTTADGRFTNSLALLGDLGRFDDGPAISGSAVDAITRWAIRRGY